MTGINSSLTIESITFCCSAAETFDNYEGYDGTGMRRHRWGWVGTTWDGGSVEWVGPNGSEIIFAGRTGIVAGRPAEETGRRD